MAEDGGGAAWVSLWWWADNAFLLARSVPEAFAMFGELTVALRSAGLRWKPCSLELCTGGDARSAEVGNRIGEVTTNVEAVEHKFAELTHMRVLGPVLPARARQRDEVEQAINAANGRWHARRGLWRSRYLGQAAKLRHFFADVCGALIDQSGGWHLTPKVMEQATTWERDRLRTLIGMRARGPEEGAEDFWRAFDHRLNEVCKQTGTKRLAERLVVAYARRGVRMALAPPASAPAIALRATQRNRPCEWRANLHLLTAIDPQNQQRWRHRAAGRPPAEWEDLYVRAVGFDWADQARAEPADLFVRRVVPAMLSCLRLPNVRRRVEAWPLVRPGPAGAPVPAAPVASLVQRVWPEDGGGAILAVVDAQWLAAVMCGSARPPGHARMAELWRQAQLTAEELWVAGLRWHARGPVQWARRGLNEVADGLVQAAAHGPVRHFADPADIAALREEAGGEIRLRVFSDGGLAPDVPARWGAVVFVVARG